MNTSYEYHPIANLFPMGTEDELKELATSIGANGLRHPIVLLNSKILDGRRRSRACEMAGVEPRYEELPAGKDPYKFVADLNIHRRHLTGSQRAKIARRMATMKHGGDRKSDQGAKLRLDQKSFNETGKIMCVSTRNIEYVSRAERDGIPEVVAALDDDKISAGAASTIAALPKEKQAAALAEKTTSRHMRRERVGEVVDKPSKPESNSNGRLSPEQIAEYEAKMNAPSIYPEDLPLPVHPKPAINAHLQEAFIDLKAHEPRIPKMSRRWLYQEVWVLTQRIQAFALRAGKPGYTIEDIDPRWVEWARSVAGKVRAAEFLELDGPQKPKQDSPNDAPKKRRKFSELGFEKLLKDWQRLLKRGLRELLFATDQESRVLQSTEQIILTYFEERRTAHVRLTPSPTGDPHQRVNGSPSLNREQQ